MATLTLPIEEKKKVQEQEALITGAEAIAIACKLANWSQMARWIANTLWRKASIHNLKS